MDIINELTDYFKKFPGVGPKQAGRFVYYLLKQSPITSNDLSQKIKELHNNVSTCKSCYQYFILKSNSHGSAHNNLLCEICQNKNRDDSKLMIVSQDVDIKSIEKSATYNGTYFVLGGNVPIMFDQPEKIIRINQLVSKLESSDKLKEIIVALSANPEGENTAEIIKRKIKSITDTQKIKITTLGRGLSTGTEIEYSDPETLKNALKNRF